jgi:putative heme transporter
VSAEAAIPAEASKGKKRNPVWRVVQIVLSVLIIVAIFGFALPRLADYSSVLKAITDMTALEITILLAVTIFNLFTYWWQNMASMPGLGVWQAAVNNQTTTSVADTIPGGGYIAVGVGYAMYRSWGFTNTAIVLSVTVTGIWNVFMKLGLPVISLAVLAATGQVGPGLVVASLVGVALLLLAVALFGLLLWKKSFARRIGYGVGSIVSWFRKLLRKPPVGDWGDVAVKFRRRTINLVVDRWLALTVTTVVSHLALFLVLLLSLRFVGIPQSEIGWAAALGVFAFGRLVTALPLTPGGLGVIELSYIGGLVLAGRGHLVVSSEEFRVQVAAGVLMFRFLTYGLQVPLGGFTYFIWRAKKSWRKTPPPEFEEAAPATA